LLPAASQRVAFGLHTPVHTPFVHRNGQSALLKHCTHCSGLLTLEQRGEAPAQARQFGPQWASAVHGTHAPLALQ
jgi:hypothetical protein